MNVNGINLSAESLALFAAYYNDAGNWGGDPLIGGNVRSDAATPGHVTNWGKAGLAKTFTHHGKGDSWLSFTEAGLALGAQLTAEPEPAPAEPVVSVKEKIAALAAERIVTMNAQGWPFTIDGAAEGCQNVNIASGKVATVIDNNAVAFVVTSTSTYGFVPGRGWRHLPR